MLVPGSELSLTHRTVRPGTRLWRRNHGLLRRTGVSALLVIRIDCSRNVVVSLAVDDRVVRVGCPCIQRGIDLRVRAGRASAAINVCTQSRRRTCWLSRRETLWIGVGVPVPLNESTAEFEALLAKETAAEAAPLACGVNATVNCTLLPAAIVTGKDSPLRVNSELLRLADVTVTLAPVALSCAGRFVLVDHHIAEG